MPAYTHNRSLAEPDSRAEAQRPPTKAARGLRAESFRQIAKHGFGDPNNGVAHCAGFFKDQLYIGTLQRNWQFATANQPPNTEICPVRPSNSADCSNPGAGIWCIDLAETNSLDWRKVYTSPRTSKNAENDGHLDAGYVGQAVFQGQTDSDATFYVSTTASEKGGVPSILRSEDGVQFERLVVNGLPNCVHQSLGPLRSFNGMLFAAPIAEFAESGCASASIYITTDPSAGDWVEAAPPSFGDSTNFAVSEMTVFDGHLYAGTLNPTSGYQVWKTLADGERPFHWVKVVGEGAGRGRLNELVASMCVFNDALYIGSGIAGGGYDEFNHVGPAGADLIRIGPDDEWQVVVGRARNTNDGVKTPLSGIEPGFDTFLNSVMWRSTSFCGWLYVGTYNWTGYIPYLSRERWPNSFKKQLQKIGVDTVVTRRGGFDLWRTRDGIRWSSVTMDGLGNPYNHGVSALLSTPHGLVLGTANPFGPELALRVGSGAWTYGYNPTSGMEVWLGQSESAGGARLDDPETGLAALSPRVQALSESYDERMYESLVEEYYENSGFYSWGIWTEGTSSQTQACKNLMRTLLDMVPDKSGTILDVACGKGATTRCLLDHYRPSQVTACDISKKLMDSCAENAPGCNFVIMDATHLLFPDGAFDNVICVDGAALFDTREDFLREAFRVLKPGGWLVLSDRLIAQEGATRLTEMIHENFVANLAEYQELFVRAGFAGISIGNIDHECLDGYPEHFADFLCQKYLDGDIDDETFNGFMAFILSRLRLVKHYVSAAARKPREVAAITEAEWPVSPPSTSRTRFSSNKQWRLQCAIQSQMS